MAISSGQAVVRDRRQLASAAGARVTVKLLDVVEQHCVMDIEELGVAVLAGSQYRGVGSTPQHEASIGLRPIIRLGDGRWVPVGLDALAEALVEVPRAVTATDRKERRGQGGVVGRMFEAHVADLLDVIGQRHWVVPGPHIDRAVPKSRRRADAVVFDTQTALVVEVSVQTPGLAVGQGRGEALDEYCRRVGQKAAQARSSLRDIDRLRRQTGLPIPRQRTFVVVTDRPIPHTPALAVAMRRACPGLPHHRVVISLEELEELAELSRRGWSMPSLIAGWQASGVDGTLGRYLGENGLRTRGQSARGDAGLRRLLEEPSPESPAA